MSIIKLSDDEFDKQYQRERLEKLEKFFREVALLTMDHDVLADHAVVYPSKLGPLLEAVDKEWWKKDRFGT